MSTTLIIVIAVVVLLVIWVIGIYNNLVTLRNNRENAFANIDVQLSGNRQGLCRSREGAAGEGDCCPHGCNGGNHIER